MSKMFDALRRAEAERRRKSDNEQAGRAGAGAAQEQPRVEIPAHRLEPVDPDAPLHPAPHVNGADPFPGDLLRELGILRNAIESQLGEKRKRVIVFTSALPEEGVTTLATSYARLLALHGGERVLLIELNARTPSLASRLGLAAREGVTDYFTRQAPLTALTQAAPQSGFDAIHVGEASPTKIQVNLERALPRIFAEALKTHDTVIVDAPPIVLYPETPPIARQADGVVMVVLSGRTKREVVQRSINLVRQFDGRVLGVALNRKRYFIPEFIYRRL
ncbi:MAG: CpsD/CapB family tyrosine-protein kinase [Candidatus Krumholzibacteria bacterium]|nr:CpsD/CapB family tyrosine-protein kinase [Candidatus Krumholzibacteria bacterium]MDH4336392.1 CpsD/CapB family tyrosine-protein kinase [Candidatus Krumholzibacteria bacterium]